MTNTYKPLPHTRFEQKEFALVPIRPDDIEPIRQWRNEQMAVLRQNQSISEEQQRAYFDRHIWPTFILDTPPQLLFSYLENDELIGYGGLVHLNWPDKRAEISFLVNTAATYDIPVYQALFRTYLALLQQVAFGALGFNRLFTETYDIRPDHIAVIEDSGFRLEGRMREHVRIDGQFVDSLIHGKLRHDYQLDR